MKLEDGLLAANELTKRGGALLVKSTGKVIAVITAITVLLLTFTDITFSSFTSESFTGSLVMMLAASYLLYFSLEDAGEQLGEETKEYIECREVYDAARKRIKGEMIPQLRDWCAEYSERELEYRKRCVMIANGFSPDELNDIKDESLSRQKRRIFAKISRMKGIKLTPVSLLSEKRADSKSELADRTRFKELRMVIKLLPTTVFMCLTVSVMLTVKEGLTAANVIESVVKLSSLPIIAFKGYASGYGYIKDSVAPSLRTKTKIIDAFLKDCESIA